MEPEEWCLFLRRLWFNVTADLETLKHQELLHYFIVKCRWKGICQDEHLKQNFHCWTMIRPTEDLLSANSLLLSRLVLEYLTQGSRRISTFLLWRCSKTDLAHCLGAAEGGKKNVLAAVSGLWQPNVFFPLDFPGSDPCTVPLSLIFWGRSEAAPLNQLSPFFLFDFFASSDWESLASRLFLSHLCINSETATSWRFQQRLIVDFCWMPLWWSCHHQSDQRNQSTFAVVAEFTMTQTHDSG